MTNEQGQCGRAIVAFRQRERIVHLTLEVIEALNRKDWEKVISAAGDIEQIAGELKRADETDDGL